MPGQDQPAVGSASQAGRIGHASVKHLIGIETTVQRALRTVSPRLGGTGYHQQPIRGIPQSLFNPSLASIRIYSARSEGNRLQFPPTKWPLCAGLCCESSVTSGGGASFAFNGQASSLLGSISKSSSVDFRPV